MFKFIPLGIKLDVMQFFGKITLKEFEYGSLINESRQFINWVIILTTTWCFIPPFSTKCEIWILQNFWIAASWHLYLSRINLDIILWQFINWLRCWFCRFVKIYSNDSFMIASLILKCSFVNLNIEVFLWYNRD